MRRSDAAVKKVRIKEVEGIVEHVFKVQIRKWYGWVTVWEKDTYYAYIFNDMTREDVWKEAKEIMKKIKVWNKR